MAELQTFRSAFNGFNREDVVRYIEYLNTRHNDQVAQLNNELAQAREQLAAAQAAPDRQADLELRLEQAQDRCTALEAELAETNALLEEALETKQAAQVRTESELEAYRRAERTERLARERAEQLYAQANGALADAAVKLDEAFGTLGALTDQVSAQLQQLQLAVDGSKQALADASATLYAIRPENQE